MAILAGSGYVCGIQIEALVQLNNPDYVPQRWEGTLIFWAAVVIAVLINTVFGKLLPPIETLMLVIHVLGFFAVLIPLVYVCPCPRTFAYRSFALGLSKSRLMLSTCYVEQELIPYRWRHRRPRLTMFLRSSKTEGHGLPKDYHFSLV